MVRIERMALNTIDKALLERVEKLEDGLDEIISDIELDMFGEVFTNLNIIYRKLCELTDRNVLTQEDLSDGRING